MSKINRLELYLMQKKFFNDLAKKTAAYLKTLTTAVAFHYLKQFAEAELNKIKNPAVRAFAKVLVDNLLASLATYNTISPTPSSIPDEDLVRLTIKTAEKTYEALSGLVSLQPMSAPVGLVQTMEYKIEERVEDEAVGFTNGFGGRNVTLELKDHAVEAASSRLKACWTIEAMKDLKTMHRLDMSEEIAAFTATLMLEEHVREVFGDIIRNANVIDLSEKKLMEDGDWTNFGVLLNLAANDIARRTRRGAGNAVYAHPDVIKRITDNAPTSLFTPAAEVQECHDQNPVVLVGTLNANMRLYANIFMDSGTVLLGYRGRILPDAGYVYSPYMLVMANGMYTNTTTFQPEIGFLTRRGKHFVSPDYFSVMML